VLRPSFTTGAGHALAGAVMFDDTTLDRMRRGRAIVVHDDGRTPWAIAHVSDVARGFVGALLNRKAYGQAYHLTSDEHTTWDGVYRAHDGGGRRAARTPMVHIPTPWLAEVAPRRAVGHQLSSTSTARRSTTPRRCDLGSARRCRWSRPSAVRFAWMESRGPIARAEDDPFQDLLIDAFESHARPAPERLARLQPLGQRRPDLSATAVTGPHRQRRILSRLAASCSGEPRARVLKIAC